MAFFIKWPAPFCSAMYFLIDVNAKCDKGSFNLKTRFYVFHIDDLASVGIYNKNQFGNLMKKWFVHKMSKNGFFFFFLNHLFQAITKKIR